MANKHTVCINQELWKKAEERYQQYDFRSISELIEQSLEFYLSYRATGEAEIYLTDALNQALRSTVQLTENRLGSILYKMAVEDAMIKQLLVVAARVSPDQVDKLRRHCVDEIKTLNGILSLKDIARQSQGTMEEDD